MKIRYKVGDVAWYRREMCKAYITQATTDYYQIDYMRSKKVLSKTINPDELTDFLTTCPVCSSNVRILNGLIVAHPKTEPYCYGSFLPQK